MKKVIEVLLSKDHVMNSDKKGLCTARCLVSVVLCIAASFMLLMNIKNHSMTMAYASIVLVVGFLLSAIAAGILKNEKVSALIIAVLVGFVLSVFAVTGGNEGFAILWILLVPLFSINLLGVIPGVAVSTYFLIFLIVLFYTKASYLVADKYTVSFISRFPILYMSDYLIATFFSLQREYFHRKMRWQIYTDGLTNAFNRRYCREQLRLLDNTPNKPYAIVTIDLNGLKVVNDSLGHEAGDEIIKAVVNCCDQAFDKDDIICRIGGDEYVVIAFGEKKNVEEKIEKLHKCKEKWTGKLVKQVSFALGCAYREDYQTLSYSEIMKISDKEMYKDKMLFYHSEKKEAFLS